MGLFLHPLPLPPSATPPLPPPQLRPLSPSLVGRGLEGGGARGGGGAGMVEGNRGGEGEGEGALGSDFVVIRIENSIKFRSVGRFDPPPNLIREYFLKSSKIIFFFIQTWNCFMGFFFRASSSFSPIMIDKIWIFMSMGPFDPPPTKLRCKIPQPN